MRTLGRRFWTDTRGSSAVEYALLVLLIALASFAVITSRTRRQELPDVLRGAATRPAAR